MAYTNKTSGDYTYEFKVLETKQIKLYNDLFDQVKRFCLAFPEAIKDNLLVYTDSFRHGNPTKTELLSILKVIEKHIEDNAKWKQTNIFDNK